MTVSVDEFKQALQCWASGVTIVTTQSNNEGPKGMTVTAFSSVSVDPPQILVCLNESADTRDGIGESDSFAVNVLCGDQQSVSNQFAGGGSQEERFAACDWETGATGSPMLKNSLASIDCKVVEQVQAGTHWIIIGEVQQVVCREGEPLLYYKSAYRSLGLD